MNHAFNGTTAQAGELAQLVSPSNKVFIVRLEPGGELHTHRGILRYDELIGLAWGTQVFTHTGSSYFLLQPSLADLLKGTKRNTQIMYPKDIGFILVTMGIGPGMQVVEAGTGSGAFTTALAWFVGPQGHIFTYETRPEMQNLARKNLAKIGLAARVTFHLQDIAGGFEQAGVDALFLDLPNPYDYVAQARAALKPGGQFGCILPTMNQVTRMLTALYLQDFAFVDVAEVLLRYYKPVPERIRPTDRMVAHTGYLVFGRPVLPVQGRREAIAPEAAESIFDEASLDSSSAGDNVSEDVTVVDEELS